MENEVPKMIDLVIIHSKQIFNAAGTNLNLMRIALEQSQPVQNIFGMLNLQVH